MELAKTSSCVYKIRYHLVTAVKYRKILLNPEVANCIRDTLIGISERYEIVIDEVGFDGDHIHIFCGAKPTVSPMQILGTIKSITGSKIFEKLPQVKQELWGGEFWSDGKYIGTIGDETNEQTVRKYIQNQGISKPEKEQRLKQLRLFKI